LDRQGRQPEGDRRPLNIGVDSLVFLDDNPAERLQVRAALPLVGVPELPADPALYPRAVAAAGYFEAVGFSKEDRLRAEYYQANAPPCPCALVERRSGRLSRLSGHGMRDRPSGPDFRVHASRS